MYLPLIPFLALGCTGDTQVDMSPLEGEWNGMMPIEGGIIQLGPKRSDTAGKGKRAPGKPTGGGATNGPPGPPPSAHGAAGNQRQAGGPPPIVGLTPTTGLQLSKTPVKWESIGGQQITNKKVWVDAFWMDRTEVTREQFKAFLDDTAYRPPHVDEAWADDGWNWKGTDFPPGTGQHPVVITNWYDASEYCIWAGKRLPTEAEWQLAVLGDVDSELVFPWGTTYDASLSNHGKMEEPNFDDSDGWLTTSPAGYYPGGRTPTGLDDAFGNAWEFTADFRIDSWDHATLRSNQGLPPTVSAPGPGLYVAVRGGSYFFDMSQNPAGERNHFLPELRRKTSGFRCAR